jgi:TolA-binding protein
MKPSRYLVVTVLLTVTLLAQNPNKKTNRASANRSTAMAKDIQALRETVAAQQQQMEAQRQQMDQLKSQLQQLLDATQQANASAQKVQSSAEQAQTTAVQAQQSATEAQRLADQATSSAAEAKTALSLVDKTSKDEDTRLSALQDILGVSASVATSGCVERTSFRIAPLASRAIAPAFASASVSMAV